MNINRDFALPQKRSDQKMGQLGVFFIRLYRKRHAYLFISPFFILFAIFFLYPTVRSFEISLYSWEGFQTYDYVGLDNYKRLFTDSTFKLSVWNSFFIMVGSTIPQLILATLIAVALNARFIRFREMWRAFFFSPIVLSAVVVSIVFSLIFDKEYGFLNYLLSFLNFQKVGWVSTSALSKVAVIMLTVWRWTGWNMVVILGGLQGIPEELYDAARVDGASSWSTFRFITVPLLKPVLLFLGMLGIIDGLRLFAEPALLTGGGPYNSSMTMIMYLYHQGFDYFNFGYASAIAVVIFIFVTSIAGVFWLLTNRRKGE